MRNEKFSKYIKYRFVLGKWGRGIEMNDGAIIIVWTESDTLAVPAHAQWQNG